MSLQPLCGLNPPVSHASGPKCIGFSLGAAAGAAATVTDVAIGVIALLCALKVLTFVGVAASWTAFGLSIPLAVVLSGLTLYAIFQAKSAFSAPS